MIRITNIQTTQGVFTEPLDLQEAKDWLQIDFPDFDDLLTSLIVGARESFEKFLNIHLVPKSVTMWVENTKNCMDTVLFPFAVGVSAVLVKSLDYSDTETALVSGTDYFITANTIRIGPGRFKITYNTVPGTIPQALREVIKMEVAERFKNRGDSDGGLSEGAKQKAEPFQAIWL